MKRVKKAAFWVCTAAALLSAAIPGVPGSKAAYGAAKASRLVTLAGSPGRGMENGRGRDSHFAFPLGMDVRDGTVMIADTENNQIRSYHGNRTAVQAGCVTGEDMYGAALGGYSDNSRGLARFNRPADCIWMPDGRIIVADRDNNAIRAVGNTWVYTLNGTGEAGYREGGPGKAMFSMPSGIAADSSGNVFVADTGNHCIRKINPDGQTSLVAGRPGQGGLQDGGSEEALFLEPSGVAVARDGSLYVADTGNQRIRRISRGQVETLAGSSTEFYLDTEYRMPGLMDGSGAEARFWFPEGICMAGPVAVVADTGNHVVRAVAPSGRTQVIAGAGEAGWEDGEALDSALNRPSDVAWEDGVLYIMDSGNSSLRSLEFDPWEWLEGIGEPWEE